VVSGRRVVFAVDQDWGGVPETGKHVTPLVKALKVVRVDDGWGSS
jgi:hypothetical protein